MPLPSYIVRNLNTDIYSLLNFHIYNLFIIYTPYAIYTVSLEEGKGREKVEIIMEIIMEIIIIIIIIIM